MKANQATEDPAERETFDTIKSTYPLAFEPEQHAMIKELRSRLSTISAGERTALIDAIERAIGRNIEEQEDFDL
jgi:hypothetical protein